MPVAQSHDLQGDLQCLNPDTTIKPSSGSAPELGVGVCSVTREVTPLNE
jgi:hypothetical protein